MEKNQNPNQTHHPFPFPKNRAASLHWALHPGELRCEDRDQIRCVFSVPGTEVEIEGFVWGTSPPEVRTKKKHNFKTGETLGFSSSF